MMRRMMLLFAFVALLPLVASASADIDNATKASVVFIANYDQDKNFLGWGTGFFVDEGIVVTNKHVIAGGDWYRVLATGADGAVDFSCGKNITKSDVKVNLDDDVAYMRVFLPCEHGIVHFAEDPETGDPSYVVGYPYRGTVQASLTLLTTTGSVTGMSRFEWMKTSAPLDFGNSGGPVVNDTGVIGVAVAKGVDEYGEYVTGYFIQSSVIERGLLYANDSRFGYTPQISKSSRSRSSSSSSVSRTTLSSSSSSSSTHSVRSSSSSSSFVHASFRDRTCERVSKWFSKSLSMKERVNDRLMKRFGFACH